MFFSFQSNDMNRMLAASELTRIPCHNIATLQIYNNAAASNRTAFSMSKLCDKAVIKYPKYANAARLCIPFTSVVRLEPKKNARAQKKRGGNPAILTSGPSVIGVFGGAAGRTLPVLALPPPSLPPSETHFAFMCLCIFLGLFWL